MIGRIVIILLFILAISNCKDRYDLATQSAKSYLVVDGIITDDPHAQYIRLGLTGDPNRAPTPLVGAAVTLRDEIGVIENFIDLQDGRYQLSQNTLQPKKSGTYTLGISLPDGRQYLSSPEKMPASLATDSTYFAFEQHTIVSSEGVPVNFTSINTYLDTKLPTGTETSYLRWGLDEVYCIIPPCPPGALRCPPWCFISQEVSKYNITLIKTSDFKQSALQNILLQNRDIDFTFMVRHYLNVTQYSMNEQAFKYWQKVQLLYQRTGSLFDTPAAVITGNMHNITDVNEPVYGYFEASAAHLRRLAVDRGFIPVELSSCDWDYRYYELGGSPFAYCTNCYAIKGSTTEQPDWFF